MDSSSPPVSSPSLSALQNNCESEMEMGPILPTDIVIEILLRLRVRDLGKFKCVSKEWLNIISDPFFVSAHRARSIKNPNVLLLKKTLPCDETNKTRLKKSARIDVRSMGSDGSHILDFTLDIDDEGVEMLPSEWDVICFAAENGFYLCNPSTQEFVKLPEASCCNEVNAGFGYMKETNDYVLVHMYDRSLDVDVDYDEIVCEFMRFSEGCVKHCSWKMVEATCPVGIRGWGVLVEKVFYWIIWKDHPDDEVILAFDVEKEEFRTLTAPEGFVDPNEVWFLMELDGRLCLIDNETRPSTMDIWALRDYENLVWTKEYCIDPFGCNFDPLKFILPLHHHDGESSVDGKQDEKYDVEKKCFKRMDSIRRGDWTWVRLYTDSFFSLGS